MTALHALDERAGLRTGERVLIHSAAGGVGSFAVSYARALGAEVIATAGSPAKRAVLRASGVAHVLDPGDGFAARLAAIGPVDVVLNSRTGPALDASLQALAPGGRFIEIGRLGTLSHEEIMRRRPDVHAAFVSLDAIDDAEGGRLLARVLAALDRGAIALAPIHAVPMAAADRRAGSAAKRASHWQDCPHPCAGTGVRPSPHRHHHRWARRARPCGGGLGGGTRRAACGAHLAQRAGR